MNVMDAIMVVCNDRHGGRCMLKQWAGEKPVHKRSKVAEDAWGTKTPSSDKTAQDGAEGGSRRPCSG